MLGQIYMRQNRADDALREIAREQGREQTFRPANVAIYFGEPGVTAPDPYFGGEAGFERVLDMIEEASTGLLEHLRRQHSL